MMIKQLFIAALCQCIFLQSVAEYSSDDWEKALNERLKKLQEDPDLSSRFSNLTIHILFYNVTKDLQNVFDDGEDSHSENHTSQQNCRVTHLATQCYQSNIFEVVTILPVTTEYLEITNSPVQTLRKPILSNLTSLIHLNLANNSIQFITSKFLTGLDNLRVLNLSDNNIRALTKVVFTGCPNLMSLDLSKNRIVTLNFIPAALASLKNLTFLSLAENSIKMIKKNDLAVLNNSPLISLDLSFCMLSRVEKGSFSHLGNLEQLILKVTYLNEEALANATYNLPAIKILNLKLLPVLRSFPTEAMMNLANSSVEVIDFSLSEFPFIPSTSFPFLPNIKRLRFFASMISEIEDGAFDGLTSLEFLDLSSNRLSGIPTSISALKNLQIFSIAGQKTSTFKVPDYSLSNLTSLKLLRMEQNTVNSKISRFAFHGLSNLVKLVLFDCNIVTINNYAFESLTSLELLELSFNSVFSLSNNTLYGLSKLKTLGLIKNGLILGYNARPFDHAISLEKLLLQENDIRFLRPGIFSRMKRLRDVDLSRNKIIPWNDTIFDESAPINLLLGENEINYVTTAMLQDFEHAVHVNISSNPFDCHHCQTEKFRNWLLTTNATNLQNKGYTYSCASPSNLHGYSIFEDDIQFDHCVPPPFSMELRMAIGFSILAICTVILTTVGYYFRWYFRYWWFHINASVKRLSTSTDKTAYVYDAFVSYNSADIAWVKRILVPNLENHNSQIKLCLHDRDFEVGRLITENILESIDRSRKVLLVLSSSFVKSEWCLFELHVTQHRLFHDKRDELILVQVETLRKEDTSKHLRYLMKTRTLLVWPEDPEKQVAFWAHLHKVLTS